MLYLYKGGSLANSSFVIRRKTVQAGKLNGDQAENGSCRHAERLRSRSRNLGVFCGFL